MAAAGLVDGVQDVVEADPVGLIDEGEVIGLGVIIDGDDPRQGVDGFADRVRTAASGEAAPLQHPLDM